MNSNQVQITALIVAEDELMRLAFRSILRGFPVVRRVVEATSQYEAVRLAAVTELGLMIIDNTGRRPGEDTVSVLVELSKLQSGASMIVCADDSHQLEDVCRRYQLDCDFFTRGPTATRNLRRLIETACSADSNVEPLKAIEQATAKVESLTAREREILTMVADGESSRDIAAALAVSLRTVESHRARVCAKLSVRSIAALTKIAIASGLTSFDLNERPSDDSVDTPLAYP